MTAKPRSVGVIGGGTAGLFAALAVKRRFPEIDVTVLESSAVPIIGVGEATTTLMPPFLHLQLGLDPADLFRRVKPTFKLGIRFAWGPPGGFTYPFGDADPVAAFSFDGALDNQSLTSLLMLADRAPVLRGPDGRLTSLLSQVKFAYHLDNATFVAFLKAAAARAGINHEDVTIATVDVGEEGVTALRSDDGRAHGFDVYVDASGFRSLLLEQALGSPFESYAGSLFCDRAIVATVPQTGPIQPYTTAETMAAGWCWRIPVEGEDHRGYVHASAFLDEEAAVDEMARANPGMGEPRVVRFRSGRHRDMWIKNVVALGNAFAFVEPLESTALHMAIVGVGFLLEGIARLADADAHRSYVAFANRTVAAQWDYLRWFLAIHYRFNRRLDTPFWRAARAEVDVTGLAAALERFSAEGPGAVAGDNPAAIWFNGLTTLLLGQQVPTPAARVEQPRAAWQARVAGDQRTVGLALPQAEALAVLRAHPEMLLDLVRDSRSWYP